jgi:hypothetical protein
LLSPHAAVFLWQPSGATFNNGASSRGGVFDFSQTLSPAEPPRDRDPPRKPSDKKPALALSLTQTAAPPPGPPKVNREKPAPLRRRSRTKDRTRRDRMSSDDSDIDPSVKVFRGHERGARAGVKKSEGKEGEVMDITAWPLSNLET